jgi:hypothetical protein
VHILSAAAEFDELPVRHNEVFFPLLFIIIKQAVFNFCS